MDEDDPEKRIADLERKLAEPRAAQRPPGWPPAPPPRPADRPPPQIGTPPPPWAQRPRRRVKWPLIAAIVVILAAAGITGYLLRPNASRQTAQPAPSSGQTAQPAPSSGQTVQPAPGNFVKPTTATAFSPEGAADNPDQAGLAINGNPSTGWTTMTYSDAVPFPGFKNGVGLLLQLPQATRLASVSLDVPSTGTKVQIRSSPTPTPASLDDTTELTPPTLLQPGHNTIPVPNAAPTSAVLVWITTLGTTDGKSRTAISNLTLQAAS
jgi:putative peptidoglycan lipid II flippase